MKLHSTIKSHFELYPPHVFKHSLLKKASPTEIPADFKKIAVLSENDLMISFSTSLNGLSSGEVKKRLQKNGFNKIIKEERKPFFLRFLSGFINPLSLLLLILALISFITADQRLSIMILLMVVISVVLKFFQEEQAYNSAKKLQTLVKTTSTVVRGGKEKEVDLYKIVPGDIVKLTAGDIIPADIRLLASKDLFINQSLLTGESLPTEKHVNFKTENLSSVLSEWQNLCFSGTNVETGTATGLVIKTGTNTYFGSLAKSIAGVRVQTSFERGVEKFTYLMIGFMLIIAPLVFLINFLTKTNFWESFLFAVSVAVGLTPEMLPAIVAINLSAGAVDLSKKKVIVKRLNSIQNFGAMDLLCTDKTGTLTENKVALIKHLNVENNEDESVFYYTFLNSFCQTGFRNLLDSAVIKHGHNKKLVDEVEKKYSKIDEIPFDFKRKRLSIVLKKEEQKILVCKGAVDEVLQTCTHFELNGKTYPLTKNELEKINKISRSYAEHGFRVLAVGYKKITDQKTHFNYADENNLVFSGITTFLDPPKKSAFQAITDLRNLGIEIKVLTGDNELVTKKICQEVGLPAENILLGGEIEKMNDDKLALEVEKAVIFAKLSPEDKKRIVTALQKNSHTVGFLGDGINDAPAMRTADVGISVNEAVDIAKEAADIILLEMSLEVLVSGVVDGRKVFGNIMKYIRMGASSSFGNMFSLLGASLFLPFLPMTSLQILTNNLLYDFSQIAIPTDKVDSEYLEKPRKWEINNIKRFIFFIGPVSSIFDYLTFFMMLFIFKSWNNPSLFQTGWFVESLLTQTLIVHVIRSRKIPFLQTMASLPLLATTLVIIIIGIFLAQGNFSTIFGFIHLPFAYFPLIFCLLTAYAILTQLIKDWYSRKFGYY